MTGLRGQVDTDRSNRHVWKIDEIVALLDSPDSMQSVILGRLGHLIRLRRAQRAFHPNATQFTLQLGLETFGIWRQFSGRRQDIFSISNITRERQSLELMNSNLTSNESWWDLISSERLEEEKTVLELQPYQTVWLTNR